MVYDTLNATPVSREPRERTTLMTSRAVVTPQRAAAYGRVDAAFLAHDAVRFEPMAGAPADCVPMVQGRPDLVDPKRPTHEVQILTVWSRESLCGPPLTTAQPPQRGLCEEAMPLLRAIDWTALRRAVGW